MKPSSSGGDQPPRPNLQNGNWLKHSLWAAGLLLACGAAVAWRSAHSSAFATHAGPHQSTFPLASPTASVFIASVSPPIAGINTAPSPPDEEDAVQATQIALPQQSADWPMYGHDPSRTNFNPVETTLSPDNIGKLVSHWQADVGAGNAPTSSAPSVADGRVYVGSSVTSGANFYAFDAQTGQTDWSASLAPSTTCFGVGVGATSAISGSVVVAGGADSAYYGLDAATGAVLWRDPLDAGPSAYPWASPLIIDGRAYLGVASGCDNPSVRGEVMAVNLQDGSLLAFQAFVPLGQAGAGIWNSPALSPDGETLVVATGEDYGGYNGPFNRALVALDPLSLLVLQANQQGPLDKDSDYATTPVIFHDSQGRTLVAANHKDENFYAYDLDELSQGPVWQRQTGTIVGMMPAYDPTDQAGGTLFFVDGLGALHAVDPATGADRWPAAPVGSARGNMAIANGMVFLNTGTGGLQVISEKDGRLLAVFMPARSGKAYSGVAVSHGTIYWLSGQYLNAWGLP